MTGAKALRQNSNDDSPSARDDLDLVESLLDSSDANALLELVNAGHGNYNEHLFYEQIESYRKGLIAYEGSTSVLTERMIVETQEWLAKEGITFYDDEQNQTVQYDPMDDDEVGEKQSRWNAEKEYGKKIWKRIGQADEPITQRQHTAIVKATGVEPGQWIPMYWDMFIGAHEMSRSKAAELIRLYLGQTYDIRDNAEGEGTTQSILRRR